MIIKEIKNILELHNYKIVKTKKSDGVLFIDIKYYKKTFLLPDELRPFLFGFFIFKGKLTLCFVFEVEK